MKIKIILTFVIVLLCLTSTLAQNATMAKAFYKKAQKAYAEKEYKDAVILLSKARKKLNNTNPDITYLEAKVFLEIDSKNIRSKKLFNQFLLTAPEDSRVEEVAEILVEFENSNKYYENGQIKYRFGKREKGNFGEIRYNSNGNIIKTTLYFDKEKSKVYQMEFYRNDKKNVGIYNKKDGSGGKYQIFYDDSGKKILSNQYYEITNYKYDYIPSEYKNGILQELKIPVITNNKYSTYFYNSQGETVSYLSYFIGTKRVKNMYSFKSFTAIKHNNFEVYVSIKISSQKSSYTKLEILELYTNNFIKKIKAFKEKNYFEVYEFNKNGIPTSKTIYKKNKIKFSYTFNSESDEWTKQ